MLDTFIYGLTYIYGVYARLMGIITYKSMIDHRINASYYDKYSNELIFIPQDTALSSFDNSIRFDAPHIQQSD